MPMLTIFKNGWWKRTRWQMTGALLFHQNNFLRLLKGFIIVTLSEILVIKFLHINSAEKGGFFCSILRFQYLKTWWLFKEVVTTSLLLFHSHIHVVYLGMDLILCFKNLMQSVRFWYRCYLMVWSCSWWANILRLA